MPCLAPARRAGPRRVAFGRHLTGAYEASLNNPEIYAAQQLSLLAASVLFWWPIVVPLGGTRVLSRWATLGYIMVATIPQTFGGITVALAKHPLYPTYGLAPRIFGLGVHDRPADRGRVHRAGQQDRPVRRIQRRLHAHAQRVARAMTADDGGGGGGRGAAADTPSPQPSGSVPWLADLNAGRTVPEPAPVRPLRVPAGAGPRRD